MKKRSAISRRALLKTGAGLAVAGAVGEAGAASAAQQTGDVYEALGVKHVINATGTVTNLGGSVMPAEVVAAWAQAARHFVNLVELQNKVGERIAQIIGVEAALVTTGAAGALFLGAAAAITGNNPKAVARLPDTAGMKNEILIQKAHHSCYNHQLTGVGGKLIDVETAADVERAIGKRTALMFYMNKEEPEQAEAGRESPAGRRQPGIARRQWIELARRHRIPTLLDAAADVPPVERLSSYNRMGFDLVAFSGGKAIRGPNDTGLLLGRKDLIDAARRNTNPNCGTIGRMMKVSKEDTIALLAAVERFVRLDHQAEWKELERRISVIEEAVRPIPAVQCERILPGVANQFPHLQLTWDERRVRLTREQFTRALMQGDPPVQIGRVSNTGNRGVLISVFCLQPGEEKVVSDRVVGILRAAAQG